MDDYFSPGPDQRKDLEKSNNDFIELVWPKLQHLFKDKKLYNLEEDKSELARILDIETGSDYLIYGSGKGCRGISSRIQWQRKSFDTFTIRCSRNKTGFETEFEKKTRDRQSHNIYATLTCQAYIHPDTRDVLSIGLVNTNYLYDYVSKHMDEIKRIQNKDGSSDFLVVHWWQLQQDPDCQIKVIK